MSITLSAEQQSFVDAVDAFCRRECGTRAQRDELTVNGTEKHSTSLYRKMAELGWLGLTVPEEFGGGGAGMFDLALFLEHVGYGLAPIGGFTTSVIAAAPYQQFGTEQQRETALGELAGGVVSAISMSEPGAGSDVGALSCRAERTDDGFVINGQKTWCSNAHIAKRILLVARTSTGVGKHDGLTMFDVPADTAGLRISRISTMGGREVNDLYFTDCHLPESAVVGAVDAGWKQLMVGLNLERMILASSMLGLARRALDDTLAYVRQRQQFGRPIGSFQALRHRLADLATEVECTRLIVYNVAQLVDENPGRTLPREASMAKLKATETARAVTLEGMQMMGGYGYATEYDMEGHVRAALASTIYGGTSEIQRDIIGKTYQL